MAKRAYLPGYSGVPQEGVENVEEIQSEAVKVAKILALVRRQKADA